MRLRFLFFVFLLAWLALVIRLFYWQVKSFDKLFLAARLQQQSKSTLVAPRGKILSADNYPLVFSTLKFSLILNPSIISDPQKVLAEIASSSAQKIDQEKFFKVVEDKNLSWYSLLKGLSLTEKEEIEKKNLPGIEFESSWSRAYPEASMAAQTLGFVGIGDNDKERGYYGLEGFYDRELSGVAGEKTWERDLLGRLILLGERKETSSRPGRDLSLYLDRSIQFLVEKALSKGIAQYRAVSGSVVVMDPFTGGVLALASWPAYDPANFANEDKNNFANPTIYAGFEPGSIFKPLVMATAIDLGLLRPDSICPICTGSVQIGEYTIKTWNEKYFPNSTMTEVIQHSDNVGMVYVAKKIGIENLYSYLVKLGFGEKTGIDLEEEASPTLRSEKDWGEIDLATAGFGQGIAVTAVQMTRAIAAIANGGKLVIPRVVAKIKDGDKEILLKQTEPKQVFKPITTKVIKEMMVNAVENGEAKWAKPKNYKIAGKTGTAQIPLAGHYDEKKTIASFVGFAPADRPLFVMLVTLREPKSSPWGSETAAPLWFEIAKGIFQVKGIPPS